MSSRMEKKKLERRVNILNAAESIIAEHGYKSMTMDQVAIKADVAKGTLYIYFKNKETLCAAVNARINKELNQHINEKMGNCHNGSEKIVAASASVIEFSHNYPRKWKTVTDLYQMKYEHPDDRNVQELINEANKTVQLLADAYRQGKKEGTILEDVDPVATAIYNRMAVTNAFTPTSEQELLLKLNNISPEHYLNVSWNLINRSTHVRSSIREESDKPLEEQRSEEDISLEISELVKSMELPSDNAPQIVDAWKRITEITMGNTVYETMEESDERVVNCIISCPAVVKDGNAYPEENVIDGCQRYCKILVNTLNSKYTQKFTKMMCAGDEHCISIVELNDSE